MKKIHIVSIIVLFCMSIMSGCGMSSEDNPLIGKNTDERVVMCLEETYPEHKFTVVKSFDKTKDRGIYADENGVEFEVHNLLYDNYKHFGCEDEYLSTKMKEQNFEEKALQIGVKHGQRIVICDAYISIDFYLEDILEGKLSMKEATEIILELLNCVEIPEVVIPDSAGSFSTNEINYYCNPTWGRIGFGFENKNSTFGWGYGIDISDKNESVENIEKQLEDVFNRLYEEEEYAHLKENGDMEYTAPKYENGGSVSTDYGDYILPKDWCINEEKSTESFNVHMDENVIFQEETSYFLIESGKSPYSKEEYGLFKQRILSQLIQDYNLSEDVNIDMDSSTTENSNIVYSFDFRINENERVSLNYIVGDRRYCLIKEVEYKGGGYTFDAAQYVINSFIWKE